MPICNYLNNKSLMTKIIEMQVIIKFIVILLRADKRMNGFIAFSSLLLFYG